MDSLSGYLRNLPKGEDLGRLSVEELVEELADHNPKSIYDSPEIENAIKHYGYAMASAKAGKKEEAIAHMQHVRQFLNPYPTSMLNMVMLRHAAKIGKSLDAADQERFMFVICGDRYAMKVIQVDEKISKNPYEVYESASSAERRHANSHILDPLLLAPQNPNLVAESVRIAGNMKPLAEAFERYAEVHRKMEDSYAKIGTAKSATEMFKKNAGMITNTIKLYQQELPIDSKRLLSGEAKEILNRISTISPDQFRAMTVRELVLLPQDQWESTVADLPVAMKKRVPLVEDLRVKWRPQLFETQDKQTKEHLVINKII